MQELPSKKANIIKVFFIIIYDFIFHETGKSHMILFVSKNGIVSIINS